MVNRTRMPNRKVSDLAVGAAVYAGGEALVTLVNPVYQRNGARRCVFNATLKKKTGFGACVLELPAGPKPSRRLLAAPWHGTGRSDSAIRCKCTSQVRSAEHTTFEIYGRRARYRGGGGG